MFKTISETTCDSVDIAGYIDGELDAACEAHSERHFAECSVCRDELNSQKIFLRMLDGGLRGESEIELPPDFARTVVATAENTVVGLRRPVERFNAFFICSSLLVFVLFAFGSYAAGIIDATAALFTKGAAVVVFFAQVAFSFLIGLAVFTRSAAGLLSTDLTAGVVLAVIASAAVAAFSLRIRQPRRA